jgi:hypothetical protein
MGAPREMSELGMSKGLDWAKTGTAAAMAEWLRAKLDALCVVVVRANGAVLAADPRLAPIDATEKVAEYLPQLAADLERSRKEKRSAARLELERVPE